MEIAILVDENDNIIGYKDRSTLQDGDIYRVAALMIKNSRWEFLLAQRSLSKKNNPWLWSFSAAGWCMKWETYDENIIRETEEEIWITWLDFTKVCKKRIVGDYDFYCQFYLAIVDAPIEYFTKQDEEVKDLRWFSLDEIKKWEYMWYAFAENLMNNIHEFETV